MKSAPISLLEYFATDINLSANPAFAPDKGMEIKPEEFRVTPRTARASQGNDDHRWQVTLEIAHQAAPETNFPYAFRVVVVGFFKAESWVKPEDEERTVHIQGTSMLYSMAREIVRALTGRGPYRPVIIPTVSFYEQKPMSTTTAQPEQSQAVAEKTARRTK